MPPPDPTCHDQKPSPDGLDSMSCGEGSTAERTAEQLEQVQAALRLIESAQQQVAEAARQLCVVPGFADQWSELCQLYDQIKAQWHVVDARRSELGSRYR